MTSSGGEDVDGVADRLAHLPDAVGAEDDRRLGVDRLRLGERVAVAGVERADDLARQLEVGGLVLADRHERRLVDDDVGGLQDRIGEQAVVDVVGLAALLLLVRRRALEPAHRRDRREQPGQLGDLGTMALDEQRAAFRIEAEGQERGGHLARPRPQQVRIVRGWSARGSRRCSRSPRTRPAGGRSCGSRPGRCRDGRPRTAGSPRRCAAGPPARRWARAREPGRSSWLASVADGVHPGGRSDRSATIRPMSRPARTPS